MAGLEKRRCMRIPLCREIDIKAPRWERFITSNVSSRGVFVRMAANIDAGQLIQLRISLPRESGTIGMMARVARRVSPRAGAESGTIPGIGIEFFCLSGQVLAAWDQFVRELLAVYYDNPGSHGYKLNALISDAAAAPKTLSSNTSPAPRRSVPGERTNLIFHARNVDQLARFVHESLATGRFDLNIPYKMAKDSLVSLRVIHPLSYEEFPLPGAVAGEGAQKGLSVRFDPMTRTMMDDFQAFVTTGNVPAQAEVPS